MLTTTHDQGAVRVLRFNRPEALNAFNGAMFDAVAEELLAAAENDDVKVLIPTGEDPAFATSMDLADNPSKQLAPELGFEGMFEAFIEFPKPILLAINGLGVGFGCTVTGLADLVFMAESAKLLARTVEQAQVLAAKPLASLIATKEMLMAPRRKALREASEIETAALGSLMGGPANQETMAAFKERREPDCAQF